MSQSNWYVHCAFPQNNNDIVTSTTTTTTMTMSLSSTQYLSHFHIGYLPMSLTHIIHNEPLSSLSFGRLRSYSMADRMRWQNTNIQHERRTARNDSLLYCRCHRHRLVMMCVCTCLGSSVLFNSFYKWHSVDIFFPLFRPD